MTLDRTFDQTIEPGRPSRRTVVAGVLWATPVVMGLSATPAFAASPENMGLNANTGVHPSSITSTPYAWAYPGEFTGNTHFIEVVIKSESVALTGGTSTLNGWVVMSSSASEVVLRYPVPVSGSGFSSSPFSWAWNEPATDMSITVTGRITGTPVTNFV